MSFRQKKMLLFSKMKRFYHYLQVALLDEETHGAMQNPCDESLSQVLDIRFGSEGFAAFTSKLAWGQERKILKKSKCLWYESSVWRRCRLSTSSHLKFVVAISPPLQLQRSDAAEKQIANLLRMTCSMKPLTSCNTVHISMATQGRPQLIDMPIQYISFHMIGKIIWLSIFLISVRQRKN